MEYLLQHALDALILGAIYALLGIGLTIIVGIMKIINFTHGELYTIGAYTAFVFVALVGGNYFVALALAVVVGATAGALIELILIRPMRNADMDSTMLVLIGAWIILQNGENWIWGGRPQSIPSPFSIEPLVLGPVSVDPLRAFVFAMAICLIVVAHASINYTRLGKAMRATFADRDAAALMGININSIYTLSFAFGSALAAVAGALLGPIFVVTPTMGNVVTLKAFAIIILGGLGNFKGAAIGGFLLAFVEEFGAGYISSSYRDAMAFLVIILVLTFRPKGLFAKAERVS
ncbi:branched-chain amino acid ABC transporter permease [Mesorhizobium sp. M7A.F.Ca.US.006.01.1.1]|uniref:branched-chain amino acid ABC transporter permease n=1 Tax=Mesorhizobium sp. M7A.F.Ca.US.006.01.1.1 TaxID=2496707 RepID=UPI000FCAC748|nr:branched-chain amino acid ABC transporter permease [Mesorhizobium sp. M7A.F.Ca.US.006.01.1.1]RUZ71008.1 branched-chain amino acid ABC transporter permease [Mesorhizobium sp. M7A.F.Ca.US.006.01.1.1]